MAKQKNSNGRKLATPQSVDSAIWSICDIMRRSNCAGAMQYVPELTWILFLRILDETEAEEAEQAAAVRAEFMPSLRSPYRWQDWAAPFDDSLLAAAGKERAQGWKRKQLTEGAMGKFFAFVNEDLLPHLKKLRDKPNATPRQKVIGEIMAGVERVRIDTERNLLDVLDKVHEITLESVDKTHVFPLSQVYEGLLLKMGEKGNDAGQFFTPRQIIKAIVKTISPRIGETVYDPCCGTGGFLAQAYELMRERLGDATTGEQLETLKRCTFYGREKENLIFPIALANLVLHGIDEPHLWHGNTLTGGEAYGGLFQDAPGLYDVVLTNPPFGGKEGKEAQTQFTYKTSATQVLFLQHVIESLKTGAVRARRPLRRACICIGSTPPTPLLPHLPDPLPLAPAAADLQPQPFTPAPSSPNPPPPPQNHISLHLLHGGTRRHRTSPFPMTTSRSPTAKKAVSPRRNVPVPFLNHPRIGSRPLAICEPTASPGFAKDRANSQMQHEVVGVQLTARRLMTVRIRVRQPRSVPARR